MYTDFVKPLSRKAQGILKLKKKKKKKSLLTVTRKKILKKLIWTLDHNLSLKENNLFKVLIMSCQIEQMSRELSRRTAPIH